MLVVQIESDRRTLLFYSVDVHDYSPKAPQFLFQLIVRTSQLVTGVAFATIFYLVASAHFVEAQLRVDLHLFCHSLRIDYAGKVNPREHLLRR